MLRTLDHECEECAKINRRPDAAETCQDDCTHDEWDEGRDDAPLDLERFEVSVDAP